MLAVEAAIKNASDASVDVSVVPKIKPVEPLVGFKCPEEFTVTDRSNKFHIRRAGIGYTAYLRKIALLRSNQRQNFIFQDLVVRKLTALTFSKNVFS